MVLESAIYFQHMKYTKYSPTKRNKSSSNIQNSEIEMECRSENKSEENIIRQENKLLVNSPISYFDYFLFRK